MSRTLLVRPGAAQDIDEAAAYYEEQAGAELVSRFLNTIDGAIKAIVYYQATSTQVIVLAVVHGARHPRRWKRRR